MSPWNQILTFARSEWISRIIILLTVALVITLFIAVGQSNGALQNLPADASQDVQNMATNSHNAAWTNVILVILILILHFVKYMYA